MFEGSLVESTALLQNRNRWPAFLSLTAQATVALVMIAVPMLHPELLPMHAPSLSLVPPPATRPPQPPPPPQHLRATFASDTTAPAAPSAPQPQRSFIRTLLPATSSMADTALSSSIGTGMADRSLSALGIGNSTETPNVRALTPAPPAHRGPLNVSAGVTAGLLLTPMHPDYPAIAKASRTEGTVVIRAFISTSGQIERAQVLSGPIMLQSAALQAVEQARYRPYLLNGQPTEVETTVTINFRLGS